jgi:alkanesulfonate monooxygenase SsuD/methylene tetrahydromethanopterin reductase-like flavin-dependent oxidoreductase (luciferase family)
VRRSVVFPADLFAELVPLAQAAERAGFHRVWTTEWASRDAPTRALMVALGTSSINVGTGIAYAFTRLPVAAAALAADIYAASGGRFAIGLGVGTRGVRRRLYGDAFDRPALRFVEYVKLMRAAWQATNGLRFAGDFYEVDMPGFRPSHDPEFLRGLEICSAGTNKLMLRLAASVCDGLLLHAVTRPEPYFRNTVLPAIGRGVGERVDGREPWVAQWCITAVAHDEETARRYASRTLAFYYSTPSYAATVEGTGWEAAVTALQDRFRETAAAPDWSELERMIPDEMIDAVTVAGTPAQVQERLRHLEPELTNAGVGELVLQPAVAELAPATVEEIHHAVIEACAPALSAVADG